MARSAMAQETISALRREIARIENSLPERLEMPGADSATVLRHHGRPEDATPFAHTATGAPRFDAALGGGILEAALTEITGRETRDGGIVSGFALALATIASQTGGDKVGSGRPVLWISMADMLAEAGFPYAPGVKQFFSLEPDKLLLARVNRIEDALWATEEATMGGFSAIFLEVRGNPAKLDLTATRRLNHRARQAGQPIFLIRHSAKPEPTAALTRLLISPASTSLRETIAGPLPRSIGPPAFAITLTKSRTGRTGTFVLEWSPHDFAFQERRAPAERQSARKSEQRAQDSGSLAAASFDGSHFASQVRSGLAPVRKDRLAG